MTLIQRLIDLINNNAAAKLHLTQLCESSLAARRACNTWKYPRWLGQAAGILSIGLSLLCHAQPALALKLYKPLKEVCVRNRTAEKEAFIRVMVGNVVYRSAGPFSSGQIACINVRDLAQEYQIQFIPRLQDLDSYATCPPPPKPFFWEPRRFLYRGSGTTPNIKCESLFLFQSW
ncbi:hypothetical protein [Bradyrhizobium sp. CB3481]|uniref:hypothetical protein n=1 Tax=Bradyrhizobium sp. CB3481 TaxID=3039158 RepID=UPI0024B21B75|nr:hypothetical protein [Bradyrhizobium sp. CB3481]WFU19435.1 hypothetical protein QA643_14440 [Bradyrhizobium sp. CB3481]